MGGELFEVLAGEFVAGGVVGFEGGGEGIFSPLIEIFTLLHHLLKRQQIRQIPPQLPPMLSLKRRELPLQRLLTNREFLSSKFARQFRHEGGVCFVNHPG